MSEQIEFYLNFKKKISKHGVQFDLYKSTKFTPAKNSETIKCTLNIPEAYFKTNVLNAHFELNPTNPKLAQAEAKVEDSKLTELENELRELTEDEK